MESKEGRGVGYEKEIRIMKMGETLRRRGTKGGPGSGPVWIY